MSEFGFYLYLPAGCTKDKFEVVPLKSRVPGYEEFQGAIKEDLTMSMLHFGPSGQYEIWFDDNGLMCDHPIATVDINRHIIHGPCVIWRHGQDDNGEGHSIGLTQADVIFLKTKLKLLHGKQPKGFPKNPQITVTPFETTEDMIKASNERKKFAAKENQDNWGDA